MADAEPTVAETSEETSEETQYDQLGQLHDELIKLFKRLTPHRQNLAHIAKTEPERFVRQLVNIIPGTVVAGLHNMVGISTRLVEELMVRDMDHEERLVLIENSPLMLAQRASGFEEPLQLDELLTDLLALINATMTGEDLPDAVIERLPAMRAAVEGMQTSLHAALGDQDEDVEEAAADEPEPAEETVDAEAHGDAQFGDQAGAPQAHGPSRGEPETPAD